MGRHKRNIYGTVEKVLGYQEENRQEWLSEDNGTNSRKEKN